jgi:3-hydroxy-9,10-secoandrosta-1,3,5(10)-triene-9,17-dione monooxygenase reductase component
MLASTEEPAMAECPVMNTQIDAAEFRSVIGHFCSGVTVMAALNDGTPVGLTCQSFFSLSLDPALVAFSVSRTSSSFPAIRDVGSLVINILGAGQEEVSNGFARSGTDKWAGVSWQPSVNLGHPVIQGVVAHLECEIAEVIDGGDHLLVIARVRHLEAHVTQPERQPNPLLFYRGRYSRLEHSRIAESSDR